MQNEWLLILERMREEVLPAIGVVGFLPCLHDLHPSLLPNVAVLDALPSVSDLVFEQCQLEGCLDVFVMFSVEVL